MKTFVTFVLLVAAFGAIDGRIINRRLDHKIVGGEEAQPYSIPFQVSFQTQSGFHFCGGAVIREDVIMTAAHCCVGQSASQVKIVAGEHNLFKDEGYEQTRDVSYIIIHEDYATATDGDDICLLVLNEPLDFTDGTVGAVELPDQGEEYEGGDPAVVSGWGTLSSGGQASDVLMKVEVPIVSDTICNVEYLFQIEDSMICAGEYGKDSCQGDSGGPLTCGGVHCGIVSWGIGCGGRFHPGVYTQTSYFVDWIDLKLQSITTTPKTTTTMTTPTTTTSEEETTTLD